MAKKKFSNAERYAIWTAHNERCWICRAPVGLLEVEIDHVIPENLEGSAKLPQILHDLKRPKGFGLNSYENWLPAHDDCNRHKASLVFDPAPIILIALQRAAEKATKAAGLAKKVANDRQIERAINTILQAEEQGNLPREYKAKLLSTVANLHEFNRGPETRGTPMLLAPNLEIIREDYDRLILKSAIGLIGIRPKGDDVHSSWNCPNCGVTGWNGARCITCGMLDDGD